MCINKVNYRKQKTHPVTKLACVLKAVYELRASTTELDFNNDRTMIILLAFSIYSPQPDPNCDVHMRLLKLRNNHQKQCVKTVADVRMGVNRCLHFQL